LRQREHLFVEKQGLAVTRRAIEPIATLQEREIEAQVVPRLPSPRAQGRQRGQRLGQVVPRDGGLQQVGRGLGGFFGSQARVKLGPGRRGQRTKHRFGRLPVLRHEIAVAQPVPEPHPLGRIKRGEVVPPAQVVIGRTRLGEFVLIIQRVTQVEPGKDGVARLGVGREQLAQGLLGATQIGRLQPRQAEVIQNALAGLNHGGLGALAVAAVQFRQLRAHRREGLTVDTLLHPLLQLGRAQSAHVLAPGHSGTQCQPQCRADPSPAAKRQNPPNQDAGRAGAADG